MSDSEVNGQDGVKVATSTLQWNPSPCAVRDIAAPLDNKETTLGTYQSVDISSTTSEKAERILPDNSAAAQSNAVVDDVDTLVNTVDCIQIDTTSPDSSQDKETRDPGCVTTLNVEGASLDPISTESSTPTVGGDAPVTTAEDESDDIIIYISSVSSNREVILASFIFLLASFFILSCSIY